jgi:cytochrome c biogenesis protein CcdA
MATVHRLPTPVQPEDESVGARFTRLLRLEFELGMAETRSLVRTLVLAVAVGVPAAIALVAGLVVALIAAVAPFFDVRWEPFLIAGGGIVLIALLALAWSAWRVKSLSWPTETLRSFEENWRWLAAQLRSRLTLR